jgi:hypothetical protein
MASRRRISQLRIGALGKGVGERHGTAEPDDLVQYRRESLASG